MTRFEISTDGKTVLDSRTGLTWQREVTYAHLDWAEAKAYAAALDLDGGGWRLPSYPELGSLVDFSFRQSRIDPVAFPGTPAAGFLTATLHSGASPPAWVVNFDNGYGIVNFDNGIYGGAASRFHVRCVR
jgi:hypothetical protein